MSITQEQLNSLVGHALGECFRVGIIHAHIEEIPGIPGSRLRLSVKWFGMTITFFSATLN